MKKKTHSVFILRIQISDFSLSNRNENIYQIYEYDKRICEQFWFKTLFPTNKLPKMLSAKRNDVLEISENTETYSFLGTNASESE